MESQHWSTGVEALDACLQKRLHWRLRRPAKHHRMSLLKWMLDLFPFEALMQVSSSRLSNKALYVCHADLCTMSSPYIAKSDVSHC